MDTSRPHARMLCGQIHLRARLIGDDEAIARLARFQEGMVMRSQLLTLDISRNSIRHRIRKGRLRIMYPGVYVVGHEAISPAGFAWAAVMSAWPNAVASFDTVPMLHGLEQPPNGEITIHVTTRDHRVPRAGIAHHRACLSQGEIGLVDGLPVTSMARTLLDIAGRDGEITGRRLFKRAEFDQLVEVADLWNVLDLHPRRPGRASLVAVAGGPHARAGRSHSEMEDLFLEFLVFRKMPLPERNVTLGTAWSHPSVDCLWRRAGLVVELDSRRAHDTASGFEEDRARDRALIAAGWRVIRITWAQLHLEPDAIERDLRAALGDSMPARSMPSGVPDLARV